MITVEKLEKGTYFDDAFKISFRYDPTTVAKVKELAERRYLPEDRAWEIPAHELPALIEKVGLSNIKSEEAVVQALNTKEIEDKREATQERLKGIKPVRDFDFKTAPLPHQIEAFNYGMEKNSLLIGDEQGLGKTKESIDICVARKKELIKTLIVCGVNSVKYNWEKEIQIHSNEGCVMVDGKTMDVRVQQLNDWYRGSSYFGIINIESLRNEKIQDALYLGIKDGYIGAIIVDEIHKAKNGGSQQGKALRFLKAPVKIGLSGTPMNKAEDLWNILTWLGVERRSFYSFRNAYCTMGGFGGYKVIGYKNLDSLNAELNTVMLRRKKEEVLDLPPKLYSTEYVELTTAQKKQYRDIKNGIVADMENILASVNPLNCTLRLRQLTSGNPNLTDDSPKLDRIKEMLEEEIIPNGHKAIIFSQWSTIAKDLGIELSEYDPIVITGEVHPEQRQKLVDNFQTNPHCKVAIGTIGAMGTGLTLNKASYVFFMDKAWNSGDNAQAEDRAHRIGTVGAVNVISMVAKGTIDEAVEDYLLENKDLIDRVVDGKGSKQDIKTILNKLLNLHEEMHFLDMLITVKDNKDRLPSKMFSQSYKPLVEAFDKATPVIGDKAKKLFEDFAKECDIIYKKQQETFNTQHEDLKEQYRSGKIDWKKYNSLYKKLSKEVNEEADNERRALFGGGVSGLQDIYDAVSKGTFRDTGQVTYGHGSAYYTDRRRTNPNCSESLANYASLCVGHPELIDILAEDYPEIVTALRGCVEAMLKEVPK